MACGVMVILSCHWRVVCVVLVIVCQRDEIPCGCRPSQSGPMQTPWAVLLINARNISYSDWQCNTATIRIHLHKKYVDITLNLHPSNG